MRSGQAIPARVACPELFAPAARLPKGAAARYAPPAPTPRRTNVSEPSARPELRFGRTIVAVVTGNLLDQGAEAIVLAANPRGVLGPLATPGLTGLRSLGGSEIEREAMAQAPLELGATVTTGAAGLEERGVQTVIHAVVHPALGQRARVEHVRRATPAILAAATRQRARTIAMPLLGIESLAAPADVEVMIGTLVNELVGAMRRSYPRVDRVTIVCRFAEQATLVETALATARERAWVRAS